MSNHTAGLPTVLEEIVATHRTHLPEIRARVAGVEPEPSTRSLFDSLNQGLGGRRFIMECKSSSPSLGMIREAYNPGEIARIYSRYAAGISVLCEPTRFGGSYDHLATVAASTHLPVLCKDFIIDVAQVKAARVYGADAILLMLSVLSDEEYRQLSAEAERYGLDVLTEVIDEDEVARAIALGAKIFGCNNRNLHDLSIDRGRTARLAPLVPADAVFISESGIRTNEHVKDITRFVNGFLVGSQLTGEPDVDRAARELVYGPTKVCGLRTPSAAQAARAAGATYGGVICESASPRNVSRETIEKITAAEPGLTYVAVSRRTENFSELNNLPEVDVLQVHAPNVTVSEELDLIARARVEAPDLQIWRAVNMADPQAHTIIEALVNQGIVTMFVLDNGNGGTGNHFDWSSLNLSPQVLSRCLIAGGIEPDNAAAALSTGVAGVDLNSGVEYTAEVVAGAPELAHHKDPSRIRAALEAVRTFTPSH